MGDCGEEVEFDLLGKNDVKYFGFIHNSVYLNLPIQIKQYKKSLTKPKQ